MKTIRNQRWYTPRDIARQRLIVNSKADGGTEHGNYNFVLGLILTGRLRAKNYGRGQTPRYLVPESEINRYHDTVSQI